MKNELHRCAAVWQLLAIDTELSAYVTEADLAQFQRRVQAEGLTFLTVTLPALGKALDKSFLTGHFELPDNWKSAMDATYPVFLKKAWSELFHKNGEGRWVVPGEAYNAPMAIILRNQAADEGAYWGDAALAIRQLTMAFYKYEQPWTEQQELTAEAAFIAAEDELWERTRSLLSGGLTYELVDGRSISTYLDRAEALISKLLDGIDPKEIEPCYGTGATACHATPWGRWEKPRFVEKIDQVYPYSEYFFSGINGLEAHLVESRLDLAEEQHPCARVVYVPKDSRGPRTISAEPREFMHIQQGQMRRLMYAAERYRNVRAQVSIIDQSRNQCLALIGSMTNHLASLDLEMASDKLSWWLVSRLFPENWVEALDASRSESTVMPSGIEIPLTKFAPMGSACCFPVESLVFWALCNASRSDWNKGAVMAELFDRGKGTHREPWQAPLVGGKLSELAVFGDDLIVRVEDVTRTVSVLEAVGLKVNRHKSFTEGPFRESCGGDYLLGADVVPLRVKHRLEGDELDCVYDFCTLCNRIGQKYGASEPRLIHKLRELTYSFFGVRPPIVPIGGHKEVFQCYVLTDCYWNTYLSGYTPKPIPMLKGEVSPRWTITSVRRRTQGGKRLTRADNTNPLAKGGLSAEPNFHVLEFRTLIEKPVKASRDLGWSSVLRAFCCKAGAHATVSQYTFRKRVYHKLAWAVVERV